MSNADSEDLNVNVMNMDDVDKMIDGMDDDDDSSDNGSKCATISEMSESSGSGSGSTSSSSRSRSRSHRKSRNTKDETKEKHELLYQFSRLIRKGVRLPTVYTIDSDVHEMRAELARVSRDYAVDKSINFQRRAVMTTVTTVEYLNTALESYTRVKLNGWSEQVHESLGDYDDIFEELHDLYKDSAKIRPEIRLIAGLGGSAILFHLSNTLLKQFIPSGSEDLVNQNPELKQHFMAAAAGSIHKNMQTKAEEQGGRMGGITSVIGNVFKNVVMNGAPTNARPAGKMQGPVNFGAIMTRQQPDVETFSAVSDGDTISLSGMSMTSKKNRIMNM